MKFNNKLKKSLIISSSIIGAGILALPAITLTSCSSTSNSYFPSVKFSFIGDKILGANAPKDLRLDNSNKTLSWEKYFNGFTSTKQLEEYLKSVLTNNGLNIAHPSKVALDILNEKFKDKGGWYNATGGKPFNVTQTQFINLLPIETRNVLVISQFCQSIVKIYADALTKSVFGLGLPNFDGGQFSLDKLFSSANSDEFKQLVYGLTIGIGQANNSYLLGMSEIELNFPNNTNTKLNELSTPGKLIDNSQIIVPSDKTNFEIKHDKLLNKTMELIEVEPTITYSWYKQLTTGGEIVTKEQLNNLLNNYSPNNSKYSGQLKLNYKLKLAPITIAIKKEVMYTEMTINDAQNGLKLDKNTKIYTNGLISPLNVNVNGLNLNFAFGDKKVNNIKNSNLDFVKNSALTQVFINTINNTKINGNNSNQEWSQNIYKMPYYAFDKLFNENSEIKKTLDNVTNVETFRTSIGNKTDNNSLLGSFYNLINSDNGKNWIEYNQNKSNLNKMFLSFSTN